MTAVIGVCLAVLCCLQMVYCVCVFSECKRRKQTVEQMCRDQFFCEKCLSLFVLYRKIRHDFANYAQGAQMTMDEQENVILKQQKESIRQLISRWSDEKEKLLQMSEQQTWNMES